MSAYICKSNTQSALFFEHVFGVQCLHDMLSVGVCANHYMLSVVYYITRLFIGKRSGTSAYIRSVFDYRNLPSTLQCMHCC